MVLSELIQRLAVDHLHVLGDIYDRGAGDVYKRQQYHRPRLLLPPCPVYSPCEGEHLPDVYKRQKYTRSKVRKALPEEYAYVIEELITEKPEVLNKEACLLYTSERMSRLAEEKAQYETVVVKKSDNDASADRKSVV